MQIKNLSEFAQDTLEEMKLSSSRKYIDVPRTLFLFERNAQLFTEMLNIEFYLTNEEFKDCFKNYKIPTIRTLPPLNEADKLLISELIFKMQIRVFNENISIYLVPKNFLKDKDKYNQYYLDYDHARYEFVRGIFLEIILNKGIFNERTIFFGVSQSKNSKAIDTLEIKARNNMMIRDSLLLEDYVMTKSPDGEKLNKSRLEHYMQKFLESNQLKEKYARAEDRNNLVRNAMHSPIYISKSQKN